MPAETLEIDIEAPEGTTPHATLEIPVGTEDRIATIQNEFGSPDLDALQLARFEEFMDPRSNSNNG